MNKDTKDTLKLSADLHQAIEDAAHAWREYARCQVKASRIAQELATRTKKLALQPIFDATTTEMDA